MEVKLVEEETTFRERLFCQSDFLFYPFYSRSNVFEFLADVGKIGDVLMEKANPAVHCTEAVFHFLLELLLKPRPDRSRCPLGGEDMRRSRAIEPRQGLDWKATHVAASVVL